MEKNIPAGVSFSTEAFMPVPHDNQLARVVMAMRFVLFTRKRLVVGAKKHYSMLGAA